MKRILTAIAVVGLGISAAGDTFELHSKTLRVSPNPTSVVVADLTGDGLPEIVSTGRGRLSDPDDERPAEDSISYFVALDILEYEPQPQLKTGFGPYEVVVANIDALKAPDLVIVNFMAIRNRDLTLLRNIGENLFETHHFSIDDEAVQYTKARDGDEKPVFPTPGLTSLVVEDVNGDGFRDAIATGWSSDIIAFFPGEPENFFGEPVLHDLAGGPRDLVVGDLDRDGVSDLIVAMYSSNDIALLQGDGTGDFVEVNRFSSRGKLPQSLVYVDINGDGNRDIVVSHAHTDDSIVIFYGEGGFDFSLSQEIRLGDDRKRLEYEIRDLRADDFNGDGRIDLAVACFEAGVVIVLLNRSGERDMPQRFEKEVYRFKDGRPRALCVADINLDGKPDLAVALWGSNSIAFLLSK